ncbi:MAG: ABC transporter substrate-binding protein [Ruminococcus sp.]
MKKKMTTKMLAMLMAVFMAVASFAGCGESDEKSQSGTSSADTESKTAKLMAAAEGAVGNWGLGNEYEIQALLQKYGYDTSYTSQAFDMDGFDTDEILLASAMTYNELGLVKNSYEGGYKYGDTVSVIDMNDEGVAMLEDMLFCTKDFAKENPETVKAFVYASMKGWAYACENTEEAAEICYKYGSSVSPEHQAYMADEAAKLVSTDMQGNTVDSKEYGSIKEDAVQQTLDLCKKYINLDDSDASSKLEKMTTADVYDDSFIKEVIDLLNSKETPTFKPEKKEVSIQLKWLPDAQFMGYYVALDKGYYKDAGLTVKESDIVPGGGDVGETTAVSNGTVDFGVTWVSNLISANASGMDLVEVAQVFQRSGLVLVYKNDWAKDNGIS